MDRNLLAYKKLVTKQINRLNPVFANAAIGKFTKDVNFPEKDDEFTSLFAGVQIMLEVIRNQLNDLSSQNIRLEKEKENLEKAKDEFISIAAHQLRTPLSIMRLNLEVAQKKIQSNPNLINIHENIYRSNLRMIELVNDLLNVAKIEQGNSLGAAIFIDVAQVIKKATAELMPEINKRKLKFYLKKKQKNLIKAFLDPDRLYEVITNILSNAIKYNVTSGGKIFLNISQKGQMLIVTVTDTGIGIPLPDRGRIFTKFFRTQRARLSSANGSGLGLFIAKSYIDSWGGKIGFISPVSNSKGTTVFFTIPLGQQKNNK